MKRLISVAEIKQAAAKNEKAIYIDSSTLITPAARDSAREYGVELLEKSAGAQPAEVLADTALPLKNNGGIDPALLARIVEEVISCLGNQGCDPSGLRLLQGNSVQMEDISGTGLGCKAQRKEIFKGQVPFPSAGFMSMQGGELSLNMECNELCYVAQGKLTCSVDGREYAGKTGDVFYLPAGQRVTFSSADPVKWFFVGAAKC